MEQKCFICDIISGNAHASLVHDAPGFVVFKSPAPLAPVHLIFAPKKHIPSLVTITGEDAGIISEIFLLVPELAKKFSIFQCGFRVIASHGPDAGVEEYDKHLHFHMLGGTELTHQLA